MVRRATAALVWLLGASPGAWGACYPVPVNDVRNNPTLSGILEQKFDIIERHDRIIELLMHANALVGVVEDMEDVPTALDEELLPIADEAGVPWQDLASGDGFYGDAPLDALRTFNPGIAAGDPQIAALIEGARRAGAGGGGLGAVLDTLNTLGEALPGLSGFARLDTLGIDALGDGELASALEDLGPRIANLNDVGALDALRDALGPDEPGAAAIITLLLAALENATVHSTLFGSDFEGDDLARAVAALALALLERRDGSALERLFGAQWGGLGEPLRAVLEGHGALLPLGDDARARFYCAQTPRCSAGSGWLEGPPSRRSPGRGYTTALSGEAQRLEQIDRASVAWALNDDRALQEAYNDPVRRMAHEAAARCIAADGTGVEPRIVVQDPVATSRRAAASDHLYTWNDDPRTDAIGPGHNQILGTRTGEALAVALESYAESLVTHQAVPRHIERAEGLADQSHRCETVACESRVLADAMLLDADHALRGAELALAHLRLTLTRALNHHHAQRIGDHLGRPDTGS